MGGRRLVPIAAALMLMVASAASAAPVDRPAERRGYGGSVDTTTTPGGTTTVTTDGEPPRVDSIDVLLGADASETQTYKEMVFTLAAFKSKSKKVVACAIMAGHSVEATTDALFDTQLSSEDIKAAAETRALAFALVCMRIARLMAEIEAEQPARPGSQVRAAPKCDVAPVALKVRTKRTEDGGYEVTPAGNAKAGGKALPAKVTCKGTKSSMRVRVTAKKGNVRKAIGGPVQVGLISPSDAENDAHIRVTFKK